VDPERDTPEELARYIKSNGFPADIVGLTGTLDELESVAKAFASDFSRAEDADSAAGYLVNHTTILFLMDENWKLETFFRPEERPETIANCIRALS
jgi:protein SCO1/2